ncbi:MAG: 2-succinyl-5-enolpyruvyl-6-hydroxy-3-cyclohexene-1-carboxylic-acid synthase [Myxococcales bacterium]|nr:2-succinyl-5-enolpyruvyl-6-hydroxy-3-cyclohexene-1-carboxylic-acid synthase [Myxococcales bacterium]
MSETKRMSPRNLLTEWSHLLLHALARAGVRDVIVSPGSRSTPFTVAALRRPELRCHSVVDERGAAFFALGMAKVTGQAPLLICTSGTAGAHYLPAVIEAHQSRTPLIVLTADRPFELLECAAPQTIDQQGLFGKHVRWFADLGAPEASASALAALCRKASQAVLATVSPLAGPVHLNAHAAKPLEPVDIAQLDGATPEGATAVERRLHEQVQALLDAPQPRAHLPSLEVSPEALQLLTERIRRCRRGLIVAGRRELWHETRDGELPGPLQLAERSGLPLLVEAPSQLRLQRFDTTATVLDAVDSVLRVAWPPPVAAEDGDAESGASGALQLPDFVLELGPPLTSGAWAAFAARLPRGVRHVVNGDAWPDPHNDLTELVLADPWRVAAQVAARLAGSTTRGDATRGDATRGGAAGGAAADGALEGGPPEASVEPALSADARRSWRTQLGQLNGRAWELIDGALGADDGAGPLAEPEAVRTLVTALPPGTLLALGNSLPIREVDWVCPRGSAAVDVWVQRGANGIDGLIAGATGAAHASGKPTCLLLGDVSALHDLNSLALARTSPVPLVIAVVDNGGGRIFGLLPFAAQAEEAETQWRYWATPPEVDFEAAARTFGVRYVACSNRAEIRGALRDAFDASLPGAWLLHLRVETGSAARFLRELPAASPKRLTS